MRELATGGGSLLGCFVDVELEESTIQLRSGDGLVMYTDGVTS